MKNTGILLLSILILLKISEVSAQNSIRLRLPDPCPEALATSTKNQMLSSSFDIFPNPCSGQLTISFSASRKDDYLVIAIFNIQGKRIITKRVKPDSEKFEIDLSDLPDGLYLIQLWDRDVSQQKKLMLQK